MGYEVPEEHIDPLRDMIVRYVGEVHRNLTPDELEMLYEDMLSGVDIFDDSLYFDGTEEGDVEAEPVEEDVGIVVDETEPEEYQE